MIDKDGYLQGMQGIKMTNEAIHDRMETLNDSVVKSEDSVKRLVAEIRMLGQRVFQSHKAVQKEEEPSAFSSFFHLGLNHLQYGVHHGTAPQETSRRLKFGRDLVR
ncbi:uncharacterized protein [Apostichopus japonicus]|uniref:uncharacterized protein isoform X2 n=1 Tax=Stichopus japonicus TaxID=307972 RepID=UPI003AB6DF6E